MLCLILSLSCLTENTLLQYFLTHTTTNGLILDRQSNNKVVSVAATGFGMYVLALASQEGKIDKNEALVKVKNMFRTTIKQNPKKNRNWLYHWTLADGTPTFNKEISTIDTAIFYLGAQRAARLLGDESFLWEVEGEISQVDTAWLMDGQYIRHGFYWKDNGQVEFINVTWDNYSEGVIIYRLFQIPYRPKETKFDLPLFVYYFPLCFFDEPQMVDKLKRAIAFQQEKYNMFGFSANDTEKRGYQAFDADTISPLAVLGVVSYLKLPITKTDILFPANNECIQSRSCLTNWKSFDYIGIDVGSAYILTWKGR